MPTTSIPITAVLFDLDGTLVETHIDFPEMTSAMRAMTAKEGVPSDVIADRDILGMVYAAAAWLEERTPGSAAAFRTAAFSRLEELEVEGCSHPEEIPNASDLLRELRRRGIAIGIVTRNCRRVSRMLVEKYGLEHDIMLTRDDVARVKPDPAHLLAALDKLGRTADSSMMVGDHWMDSRAGIDAGCALTVGVLYHRTETFYAPCPPSHFAQSLMDVLDWI